MNCRIQLARIQLGTRSAQACGQLVGSKEEQEGETRHKQVDQQADKEGLLGQVCGEEARSILHPMVLKNAATA